MWNIKEEDLSEFKVTSKNRLNPVNNVSFMYGTIIWSSMVMFFIIFGLVRFGWAAFPTAFEKIVVIVELLFYSLQIVLLFFYSKPKRFIKFQKSLSKVTLFYSFQLATIGFVTVVIRGVFNFPNDTLTLIYVGLLIAGGIIIHFLCTLNTFKQAENGAFNEGENSTGFFNKTFIYTVIAALVYTFVLLILIYVHNFGETSLGDMIFYFVLSVILYGVAVGTAEFHLLAYCKRKFPSFNITWQEYQRENKAMIKKQSRKAK